MFLRMCYLTFTKKTKLLKYKLPACLEIDLFPYYLWFYIFYFVLSCYEIYSNSSSEYFRLLASNRTTCTDCKYFHLWYRKKVDKNSR